MTSSALYAYLHFAAILTLASALGAQALLLRAQPGPRTVLALSRADILYMISATAVIATGLARVFLGGKPPESYGLNPVFWTKMGLVLAIGLLSIRPSTQIARWRRALDGDPAFLPPDDEILVVRRMVFGELHLLALIPLPAVLMARGIGL